ncbi:unnamed protein product [Mesocestoides corti]|uniref:Nucleosome assembly protein 1-like 1 n=1 Tax=Mesocestoides corti TaxID=53468 RepID=A0A0R3U678_MESCO|nr:unnamed protein product [Mesocestoides corti]
MEDPVVDLVSLVSQALPKTTQDPFCAQNFPNDVKDRINALKALYNRRATIHLEFQKELYALEYKYSKLYSTVCQQMFYGIYICMRFHHSLLTVGVVILPKLVCRNPIKWLFAFQGRGIPNYWVTVLKAAPLLSIYLTKHDLDILKYLADIRCSYSKKLSSPGFRLLFLFEKNPFFKNVILMKQFSLEFFSQAEDLQEFGPFKVTATKTLDIEWTCSRSTTDDSLSTQRGSFFDIFRDIHPTSNESPEYSQLMEDYDICVYIRDRILPYSVYWYTGEMISG